MIFFNEKETNEYLIGSSRIGIPLADVRKLVLGLDSNEECEGGTTAFTGTFGNSDVGAVIGANLTDRKFLGCT